MNNTKQSVVINPAKFFQALPGSFEGNYFKRKLNG